MRRKKPPTSYNQAQGEAEKAAKRRYRERITRDQEEFAHLIAEASRLMDKCGIPHSVKQVPDWMIPFAAYAERQHLKFRNYPKTDGASGQSYEDFYEAIKSGFRGDMLTVEMWMLAHEYDD